jgi:predicted AAA+ superfamily ATPase
MGMSDLPPTPLLPLLERIADALDRLAPKPLAMPHFAAARLFRYEAAPERFTPAPDYALPVELLVGVDRQKGQFAENLRRFAEGLPANNALLWGVRGTGKSSMVKAVFMDMVARFPGLKLVELDRDQVAALPGLFQRLRGLPQRFVVLCDDLSFEDGAAAAKALKSALEGGLEGPPENVLFVATSNRRHLMPRAHDEGRGMIATAEDAEEQVSVSDRFGLWLGFPPMDQPTYLEAVDHYVERFGLQTEDLHGRALRWSQLRGSRSGRVAWQFIRDLAGEQGKHLPL